MLLPISDALRWCVLSLWQGHYVPAVSHRIWLANKNKEGKPINLKGIAIG